ncbi:MAG TPA: hypothetical protein VM778_01365 [Gemmatimonadota bacterium]|nr:hypothetical protein [Gemmatimonadota bacterium]
MTGHRALADPPAVAEAVDRALARIRSECAGAPTLVSALAEGADRLAVERALAIEMRVLVLLPLPEPAYLTTFESDSSREEYRRLAARADGGLVTLPALAAEEAYEEHAERLVGTSDVLLAIWDGGPSRGPGGTTDVVNRARAARLPLAWVRAERSGGAAGAELVWERFPVPEAAG